MSDRLILRTYCSYLIIFALNLYSEEQSDVDSFFRTRGAGLSISRSPNWMDRFKANSKLEW
jgi:hypothetical protein